MVEDWYARGGAKPTDPDDPNDLGWDEGPPEDPAPRSLLVPALIALGVVLALGAGVLAFAVTRGSTDPVVEVTTVPAPVLPPPPVVQPTPADTPSPATSRPEAEVPDGLIGLQVVLVVEELAEAGLVPRIVPDPTAASLGFEEGEVVALNPPPGAAVPLGSTVQVVAAAAPLPSPTGPTTSPSPPTDLVLEPGDPAGSGCTPGPGALPDGQWIGYIAESEPTVLRFDLVCFNSTTGAVTNDNTTLRDVPVAADAVIRCGSLDCELTQITPATLVAIEVSGAAARFVQAGVATVREPEVTPEAVHPPTPTTADAG